MNRQQRRAAAKAQPRYRRGLSQEQLMERIVKNGITTADVDREKAESWHAGFTDASRETLRTIYAGVVWMLAQPEWRGCEWSQDEIIAFMRALDARVLDSLCSSEDIDNVYRETGIEMNFDEPFDRVQEVGE